MRKKELTHKKNTGTLNAVPAGPMLAGGTFHFTTMMKHLQHLISRIPHKNIISLVLLFGVATLFFTVGTSPSTFLDPDAYYHMTITQIMLDTRSVVTEFPWLQFTTLKDAYVDHHLLYHIVLMPFVAVFGQPIGLKIATALLGAAVIAGCAMVLKHRRVQYPAVWSLLLLLMYDFPFRLSLGKANSLSLLFLFAGLVAILGKHHRALAALSFGYVWAYGGFAQLLLIALIAATLEALSLIKKRAWPPAGALWRIAKTPLSCAAGMIAGLIIHPSFPNNISFLWEQFVQIGVVNYQDVISVGGEWYPYSVNDLPFLSLLLTALVVFALFLTLRYPRHWHKDSLLAGILAVLFLGLSLKSRRYIEYAIPWTVLWTALTAHHIQFPTRTKKWLQDRWQTRTTYSRALLVVIVLFAWVGSFGLGIDSLSSLEKQYQRGIPVKRMSGIGLWLEKNAPAKSTIFHDDWDVFPLLFHHAPSMHYIVGLDPTFMYRYHPQLHKTWVSITRGEQRTQLQATIRDHFDAAYVVIDHDHTAMRAQIDAGSGFSWVYEDDDGVIYRVDE